MMDAHNNGVVAERRTSTWLATCIVYDSCVDPFADSHEIVAEVGVAGSHCTAVARVRLVAHVVLSAWPSEVCISSGRRELVRRLRAELV